MDATQQLVEFALDIQIERQRYEIRRQLAHLTRERINAEIAQLLQGRTVVVHAAHNRFVPGSIPGPATNSAPTQRVGPTTPTVRSTSHGPALPPSNPNATPEAYREANPYPNGLWTT